VKRQAPQAGYLDLKGLAEYSSLSVSGLRKYIRCRQLPHFNLGGKVLVRIDEFNRWIEQYRGVDELTKLATEALEQLDEDR